MVVAATGYRRCATTSRSHTCGCCVSGWRVRRFRGVGDGGVEGVEGADEDQALRDRAGGSGAVPEVAQAGVGLAGDDAGDLGVADALDLAEGAADRLGGCGGGRSPFVRAARLRSRFLRSGPAARTSGGTGGRPPGR